MSKPPIPLDTPTPWGPIQAIHWDGVERYYFMVDDDGVVSYFPDDFVREAVEAE